MPDDSRVSSRPGLDRTRELKLAHPGLRSKKAFRSSFRAVFFLIKRVVVVRTKPSLNPDRFGEGVEVEKANAARDEAGGEERVLLVERHRVDLVHPRSHGPCEDRKEEITSSSCWTRRSLVFGRSDLRSWRERRVGDPSHKLSGS